MWKATFVNQYGLTFTATEGEVGVESMLEFIQYSTNHHSILIRLEKVNA